MLKWFLHRKLRAFERTYGYDASYMAASTSTPTGRRVMTEIMDNRHPVL